MNLNYKQFFISFVISSAMFFGVTYFMGDKKTPSAVVEKKQVSIPTQDIVNRTDRVFFKNGTYNGSINKIGCKLDFLQFVQYDDNIKDDNPVTFLYPEHTNKQFFAHVLFVGDDVPNTTSLWSVNGGVYIYENAVWQITQKLEFNNYKIIWEVSCKNLSQTNRKIQIATQLVRNVPPENSNVGYEGPFVSNRSAMKKLQYSQLMNEGYSKEKYSGWLGITDRYWVGAILANDLHISTEGKQDKTVFLEAVNEVAIVEAGDTKKWSTDIFMGPKDLNILEFSQSGVGGLDQTIDYGWLFFITKPLFYALSGLNNYIGNMAVALIMFIIITKLCFIPLTLRSQRSMQSMKELQPHIKRLQEQYKDSPKVLQLRMLELYKAHKVNPLSGCLPIALQIILFFPIYKMLNLLIDLRHASFIGWISDLSAPDPTSWSNLFGILPWESLGVLNFGLWPLLMGLSFLGQQYDANNKQLSVVLFVVSVAMSANIPVCITIFWTLSNVLTLIQNKIPTIKLFKK